MEASRPLATYSLTARPRGSAAGGDSGMRHGRNGGVERLARIQPNTAQGGHRRLSGLDAGCVRFLPAGVRARATSPRSSATSIAAVAWAITLTLAMRPLGAFMFGRLADRFGRRPILMVDVAAAIRCWNSPPASRRLSRVFLVLRRSVRRGDGRRVGHRRLAGHGDHSGRVRAAWSPACCRRAIRRGYLLASRGLLRCCSPRSAGAACSCSARCRRCWCSTSARRCRSTPAWRPRRSAPRARAIWRAAPRHCAAVRLRHRADDGVQFLQPRHPGSLSDFPAGPAGISPHAVGAHRHRSTTSARSSAASSSACCRSASGGGAPSSSPRCWRCR